jgi:hypothetical protein
MYINIQDIYTHGFFQCVLAMGSITTVHNYTAIKHRHNMHTASVTRHKQSRLSEVDSVKWRAINDVT